MRRRPREAGARGGLLAPVRDRPARMSPGGARTPDALLPQHCGQSPGRTRHRGTGPRVPPCRGRQRGRAGAGGRRPVARGPRRARRGLPRTEAGVAHSCSKKQTPQPRRRTEGRCGAGPLTLRGRPARRPRRDVAGLLTRAVCHRPHPPGCPRPSARRRVGHLENGLPPARRLRRGADDGTAKAGEVERRERDSNPRGFHPTVFKSVLGSSTACGCSRIYALNRGYIPTARVGSRRFAGSCSRVVVRDTPTLSPCTLPRSPR